MNTEERDNKIRDLIGRQCKMLSERIVAETPESGNFIPIAVTFHFPDSENVAELLYSYQKHFKSPEERWLRLGCFRSGSSYVRYTILFRGNMTQVLDYLKFDREKTEKCLKLYLKFSERIDEIVDEHAW